MEKVIYLSFAQGSNINGPLLAKSVSAVMIRAGQGMWEDPLFRQNYKICVDNHIPFGIWWFCQPDMRAEYQIGTFMVVWNSLVVKPLVIAYDVEEIDYQDDNGVMRKLFPPSRQFNHDNVLAWCRQIAAATGGKVGIYTRKGYFETWTLETEEWYQFWLWIAAWYLYTGEVPPALPWNWPNYKIHQYEGGGLGTPGVDPAHTCKEYFNGTHQELLDFFGRQEAVMATRAYLIPPDTCARAITITQEDARFGITGFTMKDLAVTTAIIRAGAATSPGSWKETVDLAWVPHVTGAIADKVPVTMWYELDAAWYRWNNIDKGMVTDRSGHPDRQPVLLQILRCWYGDPAATWEQMKGAPAGNWRAISAIMLSQFNTVYQGQDIGDLWFTLSISDILDQLRALMEGAQIPTVPLILQISPALLLKYAGLLAWVTARAKWLYLAYGDTAYNNGAVWTLDVGHTDIPTLGGCWPWTWFNIDPAKYVWFEPDGMHGRIIFHETTKDRMFTPTFQTSGGLANRPVRLSLSPMLPEDLMKILVPLVTVPGDPTIAELKKRIAELEALNTTLSAQHVADTATIADLNNQVIAIRKSWEDWWRPLSVLVGQAPVQ